MSTPETVSQSAAPTGDQGQQLLVAGDKIGLRRWKEPAGGSCESRTADYETVGYVVSGQLEVTVDGETTTCGAGDSYLVPADKPHQYKIVEDLEAIEATTPPARR